MYENQNAGDEHKAQIKIEMGLVVKDSKNKQRINESSKIGSKKIQTEEKICRIDPKKQFPVTEPFTFQRFLPKQNSRSKLQYCKLFRG